VKDNRRRGNPRRLSAAQQAEFAAIVESGPDRAIDGVVRWRRIDFSTSSKRGLGVAYHERTIGKLLKALRFSHITARSRHPKQDGEVIQAFKNVWPAPLASRLRQALFGRAQTYPA